MGAPEKKTYNIYNTADLDEFCDNLADRAQNPHVEKWFAVTLKRWLRTHPSFLMQMVEYGKSIQLLMESISGSERAKLEAKLHFVHEQLPEPWAVAALEKGELYYFVNRPNTDFPHWVDYANQKLPNAPLAITPELMAQRVAKWDKQLQTQKLVENRGLGTKHIMDINEDVFVVELIEKVAYDNEGAMQSHCVAGYYREKRCRIYSIRSKKEYRSLLTVEYRPGRTVCVEDCYTFTDPVLGYVEKSFRRDPTEDDLNYLSALLIKLDGQDNALLTWLQERNKSFLIKMRYTFNNDKHLPPVTPRQTAMFPESHRALTTECAAEDGSCKCAGCLYDSRVHDDLENGRGVQTEFEQGTSSRVWSNTKEEIARYVKARNRNMSVTASQHRLLDHRHTGINRQGVMDELADDPNFDIPAHTHTQEQGRVYRGRMTYMGVPMQSWAREEDRTVRILPTAAPEAPADVAQLFATYTNLYTAFNFPAPANLRELIEQDLQAAHQVPQTALNAAFDRLNSSSRLMDYRNLTTIIGTPTGGRSVVTADMLSRRYRADEPSLFTISAVQCPMCSGIGCAECGNGTFLTNGRRLEIVDDIEAAREATLQSIANTMGIPVQDLRPIHDDLRASINNFNAEDEDEPADFDDEDEPSDLDDGDADDDDFSLPVDDDGDF